MPKILLSLALIILTLLLMRWLYANKPRFFPALLAGAVTLCGLGLFFIINSERHYERLEQSDALTLSLIDVVQTSDVGVKITLTADNQSDRAIAGFTVNLNLQSCIPPADCNMLTQSQKPLNIYIPPKEARQITQHFYLERQALPENLSWTIEASDIKVYD